ncbi:MAG: CARDB domain-containing protein [Pseudomonadota bacterium]
MPTTTVTNGAGPYTCAISSNTSGGVSCSVSGSVVSYTAGSYAGYSLRSERTSNYLQIVTASGIPYLETGAMLGAAELFKFTPSSSGFTFQVKSTGNYLRAGGTAWPGNNLIADTASGDVFTMQNCNGSAYPGVYNRFGFASTTGTAPYWKEDPTPYVNTVGGGNGTPCAATLTGQYEAFYLEPNTDTLTITDASANTGTITVTVEMPIAFMPASSATVVSSAITAVQTYGGSGVFTGGSSACTVTTNASSSSGTCSVTGSGVVSYTPGAVAGTDTLRITDSQGHTGSFNVVVNATLALSSSTSYAIAGSPLGTTVTVTGGVAPYTCSINSNGSGGTSCSVAGSTVTYSPGSTAGFYLKSQSSTDYLRAVASYVQTGGAIGSSAVLWNIVPLGSGYTFQSLATGLYVRNGGSISIGNDLIVDATQANAATYTLQNCNGTGDAGQYNRFGFSSLTGAAPYWKARAPYVDTVANGNASTCSTTSTTAPEAFYLTPGQDTLTIADSASHSLPVAVTVEPPITFQPASFNVAASTAITTQALGGSGIFTGGSSGCSVTTNATGGGSCSVTGYGTVSYTPGASGGTDTLTVTDSQGHTGKIAVAVNISFTQVAFSHNYFWCARASDGTARCAGYNVDGELGNGSFSSYSATPVIVAGVSNVSQVTAGEQHACALLTDHTIRCWGDNSFGQLGNGSLTNSPSAVTVSGISDATAISAGMLYTCALRSGGTVVCWGNNANGQIGNTSASYWPVATTPAAVTGLSGVSAIASGGFHSCALASGGVKCWGDNSAYQLGNGNGGPSQRSFSPVTPTGLGSGVSSIASGEQHSCAVVSGAVKCWGDNTYGQLGNNTTTSAASPVSVSSLSSVADVAAGYVFSCARLTTKAVQCWGRNGEGELGNGTSTDSLVPTSVAGLSTATSISAGGVNGSAVLTSGLLVTWGYGAFGQLGNGATADSLSPVPTSSVCTSCGSLLPDMTVSAVTWSPSAIDPGNAVTFSATIWNQGTGSTPAGTINGVAFYVDGTKVTWAVTNTSAIAPGTSITVTASGGTSGSTWTATAGVHTIQAYVDDALRYSESDETNNTLNATMTVPRYNFESSTQGWTNAESSTTSAQSTTQAYFGTHSLQVNFSGAINYGTPQLISPSAGPGTVVTYRVWVPSNGSITSIQPYVQQNAAGGYTFTGNYKALANLSAGNWNTLTVTVPSNATPLLGIGVQFNLNGNVATTAYIDGIDW